MLLVLRVAEPVVGDAHAAGKRNVAVDDERLAVRSVVGSSSVKKPSGLNQATFAPAFFEPIAILRHHQGADRIERRCAR